MEGLGSSGRRDGGKGGYLWLLVVTCGGTFGIVLVGIVLVGIFVIWDLGICEWLDGLGEVGGEHTCV